LLYWVIRRIFIFLIGIFFDVKVEGASNLPKEGPLVVCANHISWWDPPLVACILDRPLHFMAKKELFGYPVFGALLRRVHAFPVDRHGFDIRAIREGLSVLKEGGVVGIFPEGTRQKQRDRLGKAHAGAALLAIRTGSPIFPVAIRGEYRFRGKVNVACGQPFLLPSGTGQLSEELEEGSRVIMEKIKSLWDGLSPDEAA